MRDLFTLAALSTLLGLTLASSGSADTITPAMRGEDARLTRRVTLRSPHILVGELLERLSRQSGVALTADAWTGAGDDALTVSVREVPVGDVMDALWSLLSYRRADWDWRRSGAKGQYVYKFARSDDARSLAQRLRDEVQQGFEAQAAKMVDALKMTPDELKKAAQHDPLLDSLVKDYRVRPGLEVFAGLPPEAQTSLLRDQLSLQLPVSQISDEARAYVHSEWQTQVTQGHQVLGPNGTLIPLPEPSEINLAVGRATDSIAPVLYIDVGAGSGEYFGGAWQEDDLRHTLDAGWLLAGDAAGATAETRAVPPTTDPPTDPDQTVTLGNKMLQLSDAAHLPLIARLPATHSGPANSLLLPGKPAQATLDRLGERLDMARKWRGGVLLLTHRAWFMDADENSRVPWTEVRRLRDAEATGDGFLPLAEMARAAYLLNVEQMHKIGEWFPIVDSFTAWRDFLARYDQSPEFRSYVRSPQGSNQLILAPDSLGAEALQKNTPEPLHIQLKEQDDKSHQPPSHLILITVTTEKGRTLTGQGFGYYAHEYQTHLHVDEGTPPRTAAR